MAKPFHTMTPDEAASELLTSARTGLSPNEAARRLQKYGPNTLGEQKKPGIFKRFLAQMADASVVILIIAAMVSFTASYIAGERDFSDPIVILAIVIVNAVVGMIQESKAERALDALKKLTSATVRAVRGGETVGISAELVVPGDLVLLSAGDYIPADALVAESRGMRTDMSALTGESHPVTCRVNPPSEINSSVADRANVVYANTAVLSGRGKALVFATGGATEVGRIARLLTVTDERKTPLQQKLQRTGKTLGAAAVAICAVIFIVGILRGMPPFDMFMTSVSLAVAAIPEGLPAIVTIMLALGVRRMAAKRSVVRHLPAVETLGSAGVICSDKTGTLTENVMTVVDCREARGFSGGKQALLELAAACGNESDPTERAIAAACGERKPSRRVAEVPFDSNRKRMTVVIKTNAGFRVIAKGSPCIRCGNAVDSSVGVTADGLSELEGALSSMAERALRVLAVAYADVSENPRDPESVPLRAAGLIGIADPPRPEAAQAVKTCREAGITPVMITGDHAATALAVARQIGIASGADEVVTGAELRKLSDTELRRAVAKARVFARVAPEDKVRVVKAFRAAGHVTAMTGDGVNDAPALREADIGVAMGQSGTEVAREAADMVLTDDNFATIVEAVREGRGIYQNIRRAVHFLLSSNIGEIITIFVSILLGWEAPLLAIQLLWINLVTDSFPALALGAEKPEDDVMRRAPVDRKKSIFAGGLAPRIALEGVMIGSLSLIAYAVGAYFITGGIESGRTCAFLVLGLSQLVHAYNMRSEKSVLGLKMFGNGYLNGAFLLCAAMQVSVVLIPPLRGVFGVTMLGVEGWCAVASLSLAPLIVVEISKLGK